MQCVTTTASTGLSVDPFSTLPCAGNRTDFPHLSTGADTDAARYGQRLFNLQAEVHRADWKKYGRAAGPIRNKQMVELGADLCLAFPDHPKGEGSRGTWNCVDLAQQARIPVLVVWSQRLWVYDPNHPTHGTYQVLDPYIP